MKLKDFRKQTEEAMALTKIPKEFSSRYLNDGFSGGEKKRMEVLQLAMLRPEMAVLDETDSGLDIDALRVVAEGVNRYAGPDMGVLIITHYQRILHLIQPDAVHVLYDGRIVKEGGPELVDQLEAKGYGWIIDEVDEGGRGRVAVGPRTRWSRLPAPAPASLEEIHAEFPILAREIHGRQLAYLDNGATSQKPPRGDRRARPLLARATTPTSTAASTPSPRRRRHGRGRARRSPAAIGAGGRDDLHPQRDRGAQPGRVLLGRTNVGEGDRVVLTEMEHHSNIVPWYQLAWERAASSTGRRSPTRAGSTWTPSRSCSSAGRSSSASRTSRTCSARSTRSPRSRGWPTRPARCW